MPIPGESDGEYDPDGVVSDGDSDGEFDPEGVADDHERILAEEAARNGRTGAQTERGRGKES